MKTGVIGTATLTNKERLLAAYAAYNRQDSDATPLKTIFSYVNPTCTEN